MDTDGDGRIRFAEFNQFLHWSGYGFVDRNWFVHLDANRDGCLDFWEVLTLYYVLKTRGVWCAQCHTQLHGLYFTCVECFDAACSYDLCSDCYSHRNFSHYHSLFLDSFVLLRSKLGTPGQNVNMAITQPAQNEISSNSANFWLNALDVALSVANIAQTLAAGCSIM
ncbi:uncharacterized protein LOC21393041 [Morus notabilis]|nr:uncharacterized protein LOC21393041 [Morus notabilis]